MDKERRGGSGGGGGERFNKLGKAEKEEKMLKIDGERERECWRGEGRCHQTGGALENKRGSTLCSVLSV